MSRVAAEGYLVFKPEYNWSGTQISNVRIERYRASKPSLKKGEIAIKVKFWFDREQLKESIPVVEADVNTFKAFEPSMEVSDEPTTVPVK